MEQKPPLPPNRDNNQSRQPTGSPSFAAKTAPHRSDASSGGATRVQPAGQASPRTAVASKTAANRGGESAPFAAKTSPRHDHDDHDNDSDNDAHVHRRTSTQRSESSPPQPTRKVEVRDRDEKLRHRAHFEDGELHGRVESFDSLGRMEQQAQYEHGLRHGIAEYRLRDRLQMKQQYEHGRLHGPATTYDSAGHLASEMNYVRGQLQGEARYYSHGHLSRRSHFKDGLLDGVVEDMTDEGTVVQRTNYKEGILHGERIRYWHNGQVMERANYDHGKRVGDVARFDQNGKPQSGGTSSPSARPHEKPVQGKLMGKLVCAGAMLKCSFGMAPGTLNVLPLNRVLSGAPAANIMDNVPMMNILPFGMCQSLANPMVAAATAAAMGALTPMPCIPMTTAPWVPGSPTVMIANMPALNDGSKLMCNWAGVIEVSMPGQMTVEVA